MPIDENAQAKAQAEFMTAAIKCAQNIASAKDPLAFDPQGRVLIDVALSDIYNANEQKQEKWLTEKLGRSVSKTITISLDINHIPELKAKFTTALDEKLKAQEASDDVRKDIIKQLYTPAESKEHKSEAKAAEIASKVHEGLPKGSIIALQQEYHFHLSLALRTWKTFFHPKLEKKETQLDAAFTETMVKVNSLVLDAYAKALVKANVSDKIDIGILNKELDLARKSMTKEAHAYLFKHIIQETKVKFDRDELEKLSEKGQKKLKKIAETTTATPNDIIHTSSSQGLATWISGSENTAHHRAKGFEHLPQRQIITHRYNADGVTPNKYERLQIRTASLDVKEGVTKENRQEFIDDIAKKLAGINSKYLLSERQSLGEPQAFIYNLHTASNDKIGFLAVGDMNGNKQTQGAELILQGAHQYNATQLSKKAPVFCFVQNISVNGFGDTLGYDGNPLRQETTLMSEMAMMHTLRSACNEEQRAKINTIMSTYSAYLTTSNREPSFSASKEGKKTIKLISEIKNDWKEKKAPVQGEEKSAPPIEPEPDLMITNAKASLKNIIGNNLHFSHDYAVLIQSLSVFVEKASIAGCKSGNERAQMINGRVGIFDQVLNSDTSQQHTLIKGLATALETMARTTNIKDLKTALNDAYQKHGAQQAAIYVSLSDQGGPSKVNERPQGGSINRNNVEEISMNQKHADSMQAHKGMTKSMVAGAEKAFEYLHIEQLREKKIKSGKYNAYLNNSSQVNVVQGETSKIEARKNFVTHLLSPQVLRKSEMDKEIRKTFIDKGTPEKAAINMKSLLGAEGVKLYKEALEEERVNGKELSWEKATDVTMQTDFPFKRRFVAQILGPAGVGKTGAVNMLLPILAAFMEKDNSKSKETPLVAKIDGGDSRENSKVREWAVQHAIDMGYTGVKDIYHIGDEKILGKVKKDIEATASAKPRCNMIIPTTSFKANMTKNFTDKNDVQEVFVQVMGKQEVIEFQQNSRAWKKDWNNETETLPESKAPPLSPLLSYLSGKHQATKAINAAKEREALAFIVINDSILVKKHSNGWVPTTDTTGEILQVSERAFKEWQADTSRPDLKNYSRRRDPIITTPELLEVDTTLQNLEKITTYSNNKGLLEIIAGTKALQPTWAAQDWKAYQQNVDTLRNNITVLLDTYPPFAEEIQNELQQLNSQLHDARDKVPEKEKTPVLAQVNTPRKEGALFTVEAGKEDELHFKHTLFTDSQLAATTRSEAQHSNPDRMQLTTAESMVTKYQEVVLQKDQVIQASVDFGNGKNGRLVQNSQGTVTDFSSKNLAPKEKAQVALEQAKMFLVNWKPGDGDIIIRGQDPVMANMVHAALLSLKDCHPKFKDIQIKCHVSDSDRPGWRGINHFVNRHIGAHVEKDLVEQVKKETSILVGNTGAHDYKERVSTTQEFKARLLHAKPVDDTNQPSIDTPKTGHQTS